MADATENDLIASVERSKSELGNSLMELEKSLDSACLELASDVITKLDHIKKVLPDLFPTRLEKLTDAEISKLKSEIAVFRDSAKDRVMRTYQPYKQITLQEAKTSPTYEYISDKPHIRSVYSDCEKEIFELFKPYGIKVESSLLSLTPRGESQQKRYSNSYFLDGWSDQFAAAYQNVCEKQKSVREAHQALRHEEDRLSTYRAKSKWNSD